MITKLSETKHVTDVYIKWVTIAYKHSPSNLNPYQFVSLIHYGQLFIKRARIFVIWLLNGPS